MAVVEYGGRRVRATTDGFFLRLLERICDDDPPVLNCPFAASAILVGKSSAAIPSRG